MAEEKYSVEVGLSFNEKSLLSLNNKINGIKPQKIKIQIDNSDAIKSINAIKTALKGIKDTKININSGGNNFGNKTANNLITVERTYKDLLSLQKRINNNRIKFNGLDSSKDTGQIKELSNQLNRLMADYNNLYGKFSNKFSTDQLDNLNKGFEITNNKLSVLDAKMKDTSSIKAKESAYKDLLSVSKQMSDIELRIGNLEINGGNSNQISLLKNQLEDLRKEYIKLSNALNGKLSSSQLQELDNSVFKVKNNLDELKAKATDVKNKLAETQMKNFDNSISTEFNSVVKKYDAIKNKTDELTNAYKKYSDVVLKVKNAKGSDAQLKALEEYKKSLKEITALANEQSGLEKLNSDKNLFRSEVDLWAKNNSAAAKTFKKEIDDIRLSIDKADSSNLSNLKSEFKELTNQAKLADKSTKTFSDRFESQFKRLSTYFSAAMLITESTRALRDMYKNVVDIDTEMTELIKVTDESSEAYNKFLSQTETRSKTVGTTIPGLISSTADFARLGYSFDDAQGLAEVANIYAVIGDEVEGVDGATESLVSTMAAFRGEVEAIDIVDKFNEIGEIIAEKYSNVLGLNPASDYIG